MVYFIDSFHEYHPLSLLDKLLDITIVIKIEQRFSLLITFE
ncbi:hypothetical protein CHCC20335_2036 [Bacillus paralicheniformis]|nr:hypothetical protein CHCC20335_2036 [Bacillus paralicheniformis]